MALYNIARIYKGLYGIIIGYMYTEYTTVLIAEIAPDSVRASHDHGRFLS